MGNTFNSLTVTSSKPRLDSTGEFDITDRVLTPAERANARPISREEVQQLQRSDEYRQSALVRELVAEGRRKGLALERANENHQQAVNPQASRQAAVDQIGDLQEAKMDTVKRMLRDPRYKTSAAYRHEVVQKTAEARGNRPSVSGEKTVRTEFSKDADQVVSQTGHGCTRITVRSTDALRQGPEKPNKPEVKPRDPNVIDLY